MGVLKFHGFEVQVSGVRAKIPAMKNLLTAKAAKKSRKVREDHRVVSTASRATRSERPVGSEDKNHSPQRAQRHHGEGRNVRDRIFR
jgi:hypothetical protein